MLRMEPPYWNWRSLKTISTCGFLLIILVEILSWHNSNQVELVVNDPVARAYWLRLRNFYDLLGWIGIAWFFGFRICFWVIEYIHDRRNLAVNRGH